MPASTTHLLRPCDEADLPAVQKILEHYVAETVLTLALTPPSLDELVAGWKKIVSRHLPYLVAVDAEEGSILAFCYAGEFRGGGGRGGYRHTLEMSLFCHPDHIRRGIGSQLLTELVRILRSHEQPLQDVTAQHKVVEKPRALLACMSVDETAWDAGLGLRDWYTRHGFEVAGHMKKVGHKFNRWIDTVYLQLILW